MKVLFQDLEDIRSKLSPLDVDWMDDTAISAIDKLKAISIKPAFDRDDIAALLDENFEVGLLCVRLFLGLSKDSLESELRRLLGKGGMGVKRYTSDRDAYLAALESLGLSEAMTATVNHKPVWSDILVERLRSGRGSAIQGQRRGRGLEDFAEDLIKEVFGSNYEARCTFTGPKGPAKCDFAIPSKAQPFILVESKGYGATGSKMSDIIGDLDAIIEAKRHDTRLLFITDGMTWEARLADLRKIVERQNDGRIARIYTKQMRDQFLDDLRTLKVDYGID